MSTTSSMATATAAAPATAPAGSGQQQEVKDCLACRLTGAATFTGLGMYAFYEGYRQGALKKVRPPGAPRIGGQLTLLTGVVFVGLGLGRLVI